MIHGLLASAGLPAPFSVQVGTPRADDRVFLRRAVTAPTVLRVVDRLAPIAVAMMFGLTGCGADAPELPFVATGGSTYVQHILDSVDEMRVDRDCAALQRAFDAADRNSNADLMDYIDASMKYAGCYGDEPVSLIEDSCLLDPAARTDAQRDFAEATGCD